MTSETQETWIPEWTFGDRIRKVRRSKGLSQSDVATALNVKAPSVAAWESGANQPRDVVSIAKRMQLAFGVPAEWMLGLEVPGPVNPDGGGDAFRIPRGMRETHAPQLGLVA